MEGNYALIGIFLFIIGIAMYSMTISYFKTRKLNISWMFFGVFYTLGLFLLFSDNPLKTYLQIGSTDKFYSIFSLIILFFGIMLSYIIYGKKGDKFIMAGVLFSVGVHFIPFNTIYTYILSVGLMINAVSIFIRKDTSIFKVLFVDATMKVSLGLFLILCS